MKFTKREVKDALGIETDAALGRYLGVGRSAVDQWLDDEPIPGARQWQLRAKRPDIFPEPEPKREAA